MPPREGALLGCLADLKHCKAQIILRLDRRVSCATMGGLILTIYTSYGIFAQGVAFLGVAVITSVLKFLVVLIYLIAINSLIR